MRTPSPFSALCLLATLSGLLGTAAAVESFDITTVHDGLERDCRVYVPQSAIDEPDRPRTLILVLHWLGGSGVQTHDGWGAAFREVAETYNHVVFYPSGIDEKWNAQAGLANYSSSLGVDDVGYLTALMDHAATEYGTDPNRVFVTGASNGGNMTWLLSRERPDRIAAIAPMISLLPAKTPLAKIPSIPTLVLAGTEDPNMPYAGGGAGGGSYSVYSAEETLSILADTYGLPGTYTTEPLPDVDPTDGTTTDVLSFDGSEAGNALIHYRVNGGGHTIPGDPNPSAILEAIGMGVKSSDFNAALHIGEFFNTYSKGTSVPPSVVLSSAAQDPTNGPFTVTATFSQIVSGFAVNHDIVVTGGSASEQSGSGDTYTFTVTPSVDGTVTVALDADGAFNAAGKGNTAAADLTRTADLTAPAITELTITLSGTVPSDIVSVSVGGSSVIPDASGAYSIVLTVPSGSTSVELVAEDGSGNRIIRPITIDRTLAAGA